MKNKSMPIIIGAVIILAAAIFFMQGGDKTAKKGGDSAQPIIIATHNWSSQIVMAVSYTHLTLPTKRIV